MAGGIPEGGHVVLRDMEGGLKVFQVSSGSTLKMGRYHPIPAATVLSLPYGSTLRYEAGDWRRHEGGGNAEEKEENEAGESNQHLAQDNSAQALSPSEVHELRSRCEGEEVIEALTSNSATFATKTKFSQEKYLKKKQQKYIQQVALLRPSCMELCETYLKTSRGKMCGLRFDYLSALLCQADVRTGGRYFLLDSACGLVAGAMAQRLAGQGAIFRPFKGGCPDRGVLELDLGSARGALHQLPLELLRSKEPWAEDWLKLPAEPEEPASEELKAKLEAKKQRVLKRQKEMRNLESGPMDAVVVVASEEEAELAAEVLEMGEKRLAPGGRLAVYGQQLQPLAARQGEMRAKGGYVDVRLLQLFTREYQVLPQRTHPVMTAEANLCEGFLLVGTKVLAEAPASPGGGGPSGKRRRFR